MYFLGTQQYTQPWQNPGYIGAVHVSSTPLALQPPSEPAYAIVGRETVRCVTVPGKVWLLRPFSRLPLFLLKRLATICFVQDAWFLIDLLNCRVIPDAYTLRHYSRSVCTHPNRTSHLHTLGASIY